MTLSKFNTFIAECDFCAESVDTEETNFMDAVDMIKRSDWKVFKIKDIWHHKCVLCQENEASEDFEDLDE